MAIDNKEITLKATAKLATRLRVPEDYFSDIENKIIKEKYQPIITEVKQRFANCVLEPYSIYPETEKNARKRIESLTEAYFFLLDALNHPDKEQKKKNIGEIKARQLDELRALKIEKPNPKSKAALLDEMANANNMVIKYTAKLLGEIADMDQSRNLKESEQLLNDAEKYYLWTKGRDSIVSLCDFSDRDNDNYIVLYDLPISPLTAEAIKELEVIKKLDLHAIPEFIWGIEGFEDLVAAMQACSTADMPEPWETIISRLKSINEKYGKLPGKAEESFSGARQRLLNITDSTALSEVDKKLLQNLPENTGAFKSYLGNLIKNFEYLQLQKVEPSAFTTLIAAGSSLSWNDWFKHLVGKEKKLLKESLLRMKKLDDPRYVPSSRDRSKPWASNTSLMGAGLIRRSSGTKWVYEDLGLSLRAAHPVSKFLRGFDESVRNLLEPLYTGRVLQRFNEVMGELGNIGMQLLTLISPIITTISQWTSFVSPKLVTTVIEKAVKIEIPDTYLHTTLHNVLQNLPPEIAHLKKHTQWLNHPLNKANRIFYTSAYNPTAIFTLYGSWTKAIKGLCDTLEKEYPDLKCRPDKVQSCISTLKKKYSSLEAFMAKLGDQSIPNPDVREISETLKEEVKKLAETFWEGDFWANLIKDLEQIDNPEFAKARRFAQGIFPWLREYHVTLNAKDTYTSHARELRLSAILQNTALINDILTIIDCVSAKDRTPLSKQHGLGMKIFEVLNYPLPSQNDAIGSERRQLFARIIATMYLSGHNGAISDLNAPGAAATKHAHEYLPPDIVAVLEKIIPGILAYHNFIAGFNEVQAIARFNWAADPKDPKDVNTNIVKATTLVCRLTETWVDYPNPKNPTQSQTEIKTKVDAVNQQNSGQPQQVTLMSIVLDEMRNLVNERAFWTACRKDSAIAKAGRKFVSFFHELEDRPTIIAIIEKCFTENSKNGFHALIIAFKSFLERLNCDNGYRSQHIIDFYKAAEGLTNVVSADDETFIKAANHLITTMQNLMELAKQFNAELYTLGSIQVPAPC